LARKGAKPESIGIKMREAERQLQREMGGGVKNLNESGENCQKQRGN